jgi:peptidoglycan/LPS O-acetylase OafA/YrhL
MTPGSTGSLLGSFLKRRGAGYLVIGIGLGGYGLALTFLPDLGDAETRHRYEPFFTTAGAVAAGIFVTLAVASREVTSNVVLGVTTVFLVGTAALAAVLALLPDAGSTIYSVAFVALVGGGLAGLVSTALIAAVGLFEARAERQARTLEDLQALTKKTANEQSGETGSSGASS